MTRLPSFRARTLSLYFPQRFINICNRGQLRQFASYLCLREDLPASQYRYKLVLMKQTTPRYAQWSNAKFMAYL